jgi:hypothetical protein
MPLVSTVYSRLCCTNQPLGGHAQKRLLARNHIPLYMRTLELLGARLALLGLSHPIHCVRVVRRGHPFAQLIGPFNLDRSGRERFARP